MKRLLIGLLAVAGVCAQQPNPGQPQGPDTTPRYQAIDTQTLSSASEALTVQQPTSPQHPVIFEAAWVYCSVVCNFTVSQNGTAATATALTVSRLNNSTAATATAWHGSNVGAGTTLGTYYLTAPGTYLLDMSRFYLGQGQGSAQNLTITTNSITGTVTIIIQFVEK